MSKLAKSVASGVVAGATLGRSNKNRVAAENKNIDTRNQRKLDQQSNPEFVGPVQPQEKHKQTAKQKVSSAAQGAWRKLRG